jgi:hypothetical protein
VWQNAYDYYIKHEDLSIEQAYTAALARRIRQEDEEFQGILSFDEAYDALSYIDRIDPYAV